MAELAYVTSQVQGVNEPTSKIATTLFTPQGLFRDGLHSVYGHLSVRDWLQASRTCRNWYRGVCTAKCRELTIRHRKLNLHSPLRYHIIEIACYRNDPTLGESGAIDFSSFELNDFIEILHQLPNLTAFSGILEGDKRPIPFLTAPIGLKRLNLTFRQAFKPNLLAAYQPALNIIGSIASLEELTLDCHPASDLSALKQLHQLSQLTLEHTVDSTVPNWAENLVSLVQALPQLTTLNLDFPYRQNDTFDFGVFAGFTLPQLRLFNLGRCRLDEENLTKLHSFLPNLSTIRGEGWNHQLHLHTCASFQQLTSLSFSIGTVPLMNPEMDETPGIEAITTCVNLVHLGFLEWIPQQATSWQMLFKELKHLNSLGFESIYYERKLLDLIPPEILSTRIQAFAVSNSYLELGNVKKLVALHRCHTLTLIDAFNQGGVSYEYLYQTLNDPLFLPNLSHLILINKRREYRQKSRYIFEWHQGDNKNQDKLFRQKMIPTETPTTTDVATPAPRLVGIELNPGPDSITTTAGTSETDDPDGDESHQSHLGHYPSGTCSRRLNAQTFFKDGLLLIFSFLPFKSFSALTQTCTSWLETVKQVKSREIDLSHRQLDLLCIPLHSCLARHITRLCTHNYRICSLPEFADWMKRLPGLQACRVRIEDNTWTNQPIYLPTTLTDINFTFGAITREGITSILTTIPDGSPRLARLAIRVEWHIELDLTPLERCVKLTYLSIHGSSMIKETCPISGSASSYYRSLLISIGAIPHLAELDLFSGDDTELAMILTLGFSFPNLRRFDLDFCELRPGMLEQLLQFVPNIEELNPCFFRCNDLHLCAKFKHLQSIALMTNPMDEDGSESSINPLPYLVVCSHLTHLQICLSLIDDWVTLFETVPSITSLTLEYQQPTFFTLFTSTIARRIKQLNFSLCSFQTIQLSLLQQFTSLTDLTIDPDSFNIKFDDLKNRFDDCSFIPFLTHLHIVDRWRSNIAFEWDEVKRINTETYRLPTTNSTHLSKVHKAERLVGVELNPGPLNPIELQRTVQSSAVVSMTAQTLFKDALHLIYAYLTTHEWIAAFGTCHAWSTASESEPSRHLSCPIDSDGSLRFPLSNRHCYHFGRVHPHPPNRYLSPVTCDQVCRLLQELPFLIELECSLKYVSGDIAPSSLVSWPKNLLHFTLDLGTVVLPTHFIRTLQTAHSLTKLCIDCTYVPESDWSVFQFLGEEDSFPRLQELKVFADFDFIAEVKLVRLPPSLKRLSLTRSRCMAFNHILQLQPLPNLEYNNLDQRDLCLDDLPRLHHLAPQLTELSPRLFLVDDFPHIHLFHHLQSITFNQKPVHLDHSEVNDSHILPILCAVSSLTHIKFCGWCFEKATSWNALASKLPKLTFLTLSWLCLQNSQFSSIRPFAHKLKKLCLERYAGVPNEVELGRFIELEEFIFISSRFSIPRIKADLSSPHLCPKLTRIVIHDTEGLSGPDGTIFEFNRTKGLNCDYRLPQAVQPPKYHAIKRHYPRQDVVPQLVGIEPNPGPLVMNSPCLQLAQVVALKIANEFLVDGDVRHWAMTSQTMIKMLRSYELKSWISFAQLHQASCGIGQPTKVMIYVADLLAQPNTRLLTQIRHISYGCPNPAFTDPGVTLTADDSIRLLRDAVHSSSCRKISSLEFIESHLTDGEGANMMSQIILANHQTLTHLDFHSIRIGPVGAQTLAEAIKGCPSMAHLNLSQNWIGDGGLSALGEVIKVHESMQVLDLCTTGLGVIGLMSLADGIAHSTSMTTLKLDENRINDGDIHHLTESIKMSRTMTHLSLSHNEFTDVCMKFLVDLIQVSRSMKRIDLDHNRLTDLGAIELASGLKHSPSMTECYLKRNRIGDRGASALAESIIHSPNLKLIKCSSNRLMTNVGQSALKFAQRIKAKGRVHLWSPEKVSSFIKANNSTRTTTSTNRVNSMNDFQFEFVASDTTAASELAASTPSASSSAAIVTPPAAPLVGIELNPGPPMGPNMDPTNPSDTRSVSPLSTLFKDGLQHVYSWLSNPDWRSAFTTCTHWYDGAARITGRSRSIHLRTSGVLNQLTSLRRFNPLLRHVTTLTTAVELKWYKVTLGLHHLSGLRVLECQIDCRTINEVSEIFQLPPLLNDLTIDCSHSYEHGRQVQTLIDVISMCSSLTALRLENLPVVDLSPLNHLTTLSHLVLTHEGWEDPARLLLLKSMPRFSNLTHCDLWKGVLTVEDIRLIQLPTVRRLNLVDSRLSSRLLAELSTSIPNIESIHSSIPVSMSMASLQSFHSLTSLTFNRQPTGLDGVTITNDAILMGFSGSHLTSLTQLNFWKWSFDTSESWNRLFQALPNLDRVEFHQASPSHIGSLTLSTIGPIRLRHLTIHQCSLTFDGVCQFLAQLRSCQSISIRRSVYVDIDPSQTEEAISRILSSCEAIRTILNQFEFDEEEPSIHLKYDRANGQPTRRLYEWAKVKSPTSVVKGDVVDDPPRPSLVGIELNPAPSVETVSPLQNLYDSNLVQRVTPQSLFKCGLHLIYSYLNTTDWLSSIHSCRLWYAAAQSEPSRQLICPTRQTLVTTPMRPPSTLRHHFTSIQSVTSNVNDVYLGPYELLTALDWFPNINRIIACGLLNRSAVEHIPTDIIYSRLTHCHIRMSQLTLIPVMTRIIHHAPNLEVLHIELFHTLNETDLLRLLAPIQTIKKLRELLLESELPINLNLLSHLPTTLTAINIRDGDRPCFEKLLSFQLPNLTNLNLSACKLQMGDLKRLHRAAPNLTQIEPYAFALTDLSDLQLFHQVESITFRNPPPCTPDHQLPDDLATVLTALLLCHTLTRLTFHCWYPASADLWMKYAQGLPRLIAIQLKEDTYDHPLVEWLLPFKDRLKQLHLFRCLKEDGRTLLLNGIDQFSELEELSFAKRLTSEQSSLIRDYFNNSSLLPKLRRLLIGGQSYVPNSFLFDKTLGLNVDKYRLPILPTTSTSTQLAANSKSTPVTGQLDHSTTSVTPLTSAERLVDAELHPSSTSTTIQSAPAPVPPQRLVGVETNPGPVRNDNDLPNSNCSMTPHTLFKDGLLIIYSYLSTTDWFHAYRTCRHWYSVTLNERGRQISFPLRLVEGVLLLPHNRLVHHFTAFHHYPDLASPFKRTSHFLALIDTLPHLTSIEVNFDHQAIDDVNWSGMNITWPRALTALTLNCYQVTHMISLVQSLASVPQLTQLILLLPGYWERDFEQFRSEIVLPDPATTVASGTSSHGSESLSSSRLSWSRLVGQLTHLNLFNGGKFMGMIPPHSKWTKLQSLELSALNLGPGELKQLHECSPNLRQLTPILLCEEDFADVALFESLDTIQITLDRGPSLRQEALVTSTLLKCKHLTRLQLRRWMLLTPESWSELSESHLSTQLTHLEIFWSKGIYFQGFEPITLDDFHRFLHLRSLVIHMNVGVSPEELRAHFDSSSVLPRLQRFELVRVGRRTQFEWNIESGMNVDVFRTQPIEDTHMNQGADIVLAARLVGIELNPGPIGAIEGAPTISSSPHPLSSTSSVVGVIGGAIGRLYVDVFISIFNFLSFNGLVHVGLVHPNWFQVVCQLKSRGITYNHERQNQHLGTDLLYSRLNIHIHSLILTDQSPLTANELRLLSTHMSHVTALDIYVQCLQVDSSTSEISFVLPLQLRQLAIGFFHPSRLNSNGETESTRISTYLHRCMITLVKQTPTLSPLKLKPCTSGMNEWMDIDGLTELTGLSSLTDVSICSPLVDSIQRSWFEYFQSGPYAIQPTDGRPSIVQRMKLFDPYNDLAYHFMVTPSLSRVDGEQILTAPETAAIGSETTPPSSPLIGIEPNPGPPSTKDSPDRWVSEAHPSPGPTNATPTNEPTMPNSPAPSNHALNSSTTTLIHPSTLFTDGLHLILSFLTNDDWWPTIRVSHHWYKAALTIRTPRQFNWPLRQRHSFPLVSTSTFIRYVTSISFPKSVFELSTHQFRHLIQVASGLRSLHQVKGRTIPNTHQSQVMDSADDLNLPWSPALTSIRIDFNSNRCPHILHSILQLTSLTSLHLLLPNQKPADLSLQKPVTYELGAGSTYLTFSRLSGLLELRLSWTLDDLMANRLGNRWTKNGKNTVFPPSLTSLILSWEGTHNLNALPYVFDGMHQQLKYFSLEGFDEFQLSDFLAIHSCMPKLHELAPSSFVSVEFTPTNLGVFKHLHTLGFYTIPWVWWGPMEQEMNEEEFIAVLSQMPNLTHIRCYRNILHGPSRGYWSRPWRRLAKQLPQLRQLTFGPQFVIDAIRPLALILTFFANRLTHLGVSGAIDQFATLSYAAFDLVSSCTLLEEITFYHSYQRVAEVHSHVLHQFLVHFPRLTHLYILHEYELQTRLPKERLVGHDSRNRLYRFERSGSSKVERKPLDSTEVSSTIALGSEVVPPASRLVGVELNPGPLTFLHNLTTYLTSKFRPTLVPMLTLEIPLDLPPPADASLGQLLFHDGLHVIYSYLSELDWSRAITCCRQWYGAAVKEPTRHMLCPFEWTGHVPIQPHYRFNRHIIGLKHGVRLPVFSFDQFIRVLTTLPYLTTLSSTITTRSGKDRLRLYLSAYLFNQSLTSVIYWPQNLQTIRLTLCNESYPTLTQTIPTIVSLTSCTLHYPTESDGMDFLRRIRTHKQLTDLTLTTYSGSDLLARGQIHDLPVQLTSLNINNRLSTSISRMRLPQLLKIVVRRYEPGTLQVIHAAAPNLLTIPDCVLELDDVRFLSLFTSLTTIGFAWPPIHPPHVDMETMLVDGLTRCPALTEVKFSHHILTQPNSWRRLATESTTINRIIFNEGATHLNEAYLLPLVPFAPRLHHLSITFYNHGSSQEFEQFLHCLTAHFHQLRSFELRQCARTESTNFMSVKDYLASPHRLPQLTYLKIMDSFDMHQPLEFEWRKVVDEMHMKDAVNYRATTQSDNVVVDHPLVNPTRRASAYSSP